MCDWRLIRASFYRPLRWVRPQNRNIWLWFLLKNGISHFVAGEFATYFSGDWDVHWGYGILTVGPPVVPFCLPFVEVFKGSQ